MSLLASIRYHSERRRFMYQYIYTSIRINHHNRSIVGTRVLRELYATIYAHAILHVTLSCFLSACEIKIW